MFGHSGLAYAVLSFLALHSVLHNGVNYIGSYHRIAAGNCNYLLRLLVFLVGVKQLFKNWALMSRCATVRCASGAPSAAGAGFGLLVRGFAAYGKLGGAIWRSWRVVAVYFLFTG